MTLVNSKPDSICKNIFNAPKKRRGNSVNVACHAGVRPYAAAARGAIVTQYGVR
ncbi:hypothetical protein D3C73_1498740 [compost metagenome]